MAQAFVSTYKNHYRWNCKPRVKPYHPNEITKLAPEGDIWMLDPNSELEEELRNLPKIKEAIQHLYLKRMRSTYQASYCDNIKPTRKRSGDDLNVIDQCTVTDQEELENELIESCKKLYGPKNRKITPPLDTARNVFGYMRPQRLLTPLTIYQNEYGRVGYNILMMADTHSS